MTSLISYVEEAYAPFVRRLRRVPVFIVLVLASSLLQTGGFNASPFLVHQAVAQPNLQNVRPEAPSRSKRISCKGKIQSGETWRKEFLKRYVFQLVPIPYGWGIEISERGRPDADLARWTPPWHGPNALYIEGWHFRNSDNTGPNDGSVNFPQLERGFIFSPKVGRPIPRAGDGYPSMKEICEIEHDGSGMLTITSMKLGGLGAGQRAHIEEMKFRVTIDLSNSRPKLTHWCSESERYVVLFASP